MTAHSLRRPSLCIFAFALFTSCPAVFAQITTNEGDGVLNAPYRGTIDSLRECCADIAYGEVMSHMEPNDPADATREVTSGTILIWPIDPWDRSVLRLYNGVDAAGDEIDLTGRTPGSPASAPVTAYQSVDKGRFSFKAIGIKTLEPQTFGVHFSYQLDGSPEEQTVTITVAPISGSFCSLPGESEAFLYGTTLLDVSVGNAHLTVPAGQTANMLGAAFDIFDDNLANVTVDRHDVVLPGAAESVHIQALEQFRDIGSSPNDLNNWSRKTNNRWGTPWPGYLVGYRSRNNDIYTPSGTWIDHPASAIGFRRFEFIRPFELDQTHAAVQTLVYGGSNRVTQIHDNAPTQQNTITLTRNGSGFVECIQTSDGRSWRITSDPVEGWITGIQPGNCANPTVPGARFYGRNSAGRIDEVRDASNDVMYSFVFADDADDLQQEKRFIDAQGGGALQTVVTHTTVSNTLQTRKEYVDTNSFRQVDFGYDSTSNLRHRLASITAYEGLNGTGTPRTTTFTHDINNRDGTMAVLSVGLPDGTTLVHEYDAQIAEQVGGSQDAEFGLRTKTTHQGSQGSLVLLNREYEAFFKTTPGSAIRRLFKMPRVGKVRDGRFPSVNSEVRYTYELEADTAGSELNRLQFQEGPTITQGTSGTRVPHVDYLYDPSNFVLTRKEVTYASGAERITEYAYDALLRLTSQTADPGGENLTSRFLFCDADTTQDRITVDPDGYWSRTQYDAAGRIAVVERFLNANPGSIGTPCAEPSGAFYRTAYTYDANGWLDLETKDNKAHDGTTLSPATIVTDFTRDSIGRLITQTLDPGGIGQESNFDYNWLGGIERQFDTSGRGVATTYDGRGLLESETPLALNEAPDTNLTTTYNYDANGRRESTLRPTGAEVEQVFDDFGRVEESHRIPGPDGGNLITTQFKYDDASNITTTSVVEAGTTLSKTIARFDEGNFNYETRQRLLATQDSSDDPVTRRKFDWQGNVIEERSLGDSAVTVNDRVITTTYDGAARVLTVADSEGGETTYIRDDRGNVLQQKVKLSGNDFALTDFAYDALSRPITVTDPEDQNTARHFRERRYDSRGNLLRETAKTSTGTAVQTSVSRYDNAGRQTQSALLFSAAGFTDPLTTVNLTQDRVVDSVFDADGRLTERRTYNNNVATARISTTTYDTLGRVDRITDPSTTYTDDNYDPDDGRLASRVLYDVVGIRTLTFGYDGHDRVVTETRVGAPNLITTYAYDGQDRTISVTSPKQITTLILFDLAGRQVSVFEDDGGALERQIDYTYNPLNQLVQQTAYNIASNGALLDDQITLYRYDTMSRQTRMLYPDSEDLGAPATCDDCVRMTYDLAGRMLTRTDQRQWVTTNAYDDRGLVLTRTTDDPGGTANDVRETFGYDALRRGTMADRGTIADPDAISHSAMLYTAQGNLDYEDQAVAGGAVRRIDYAYDQAGNRISANYPSGEVLTYTPTVTNQVDTIDLNATDLVDYAYQGRLLDASVVTTDEGTTSYAHEVGYDSHRRVSDLTNSVTNTQGTTTIADYLFEHDNNGNVVGQFVLEGTDDFRADSHSITVDRLDRITDVTYFESGETETTELDLVGNRETHVDRTGELKTYVLDNPGNEYATINGTSVAYDEAGNLFIDEDGRQHSYDERNRLIQLRDASETVLATYTYDALGRRITSNVGGQVTRFYYDGQNIIEERDAADATLRFHVNGAQFIDERVATFEVGGERAGESAYYLMGNNYSVMGTGNADGTVIQRSDYSVAGDFNGPPHGFFFDADGDEDIDLDDHADFVSCMTGPGQTAAADCELHDADNDGDVDSTDYATFQQSYGGPGVLPPYYLRRDAEYWHDGDGDGDVDVVDYQQSFFPCFDAGARDTVCLSKHDFDQFGQSDGLVWTPDFTGFSECAGDPGEIPPADCLRSTFGGSTPTTGSFALHGRPVNVLADGKVLTYVRARFYDAEKGRWLQRDPNGYTDGGNLYESFRGNPARYTDPLGRDGIEASGEFLTYENWSWPGDSIFSWDFARRVGPGSTDATSDDYYIIDHKLWPFAFIMTRRAIEDSNKVGVGAWSVDELMQQITATAVDQGHFRPGVGDQVVQAYVLDKRDASGEWQSAGDFTSSILASNEAAFEANEMQKEVLLWRARAAGQFTTTAATLTMGALAGPVGLPADAVFAVDAAVEAVRTGEGRRNAALGAGAVGLGIALHLRFGAADDVIGDASMNEAMAQGNTSRVLLNSNQQLQRKFKHATDFGIAGNPNKAKLAEYSASLNQHINRPGVRRIEGSFRGSDVIHYVDPVTHLNVMTDRAGNFISGWRLSDEALNHVLTTGKLGGG